MLGFFVKCMSIFQRMVYARPSHFRQDLELSCVYHSEECFPPWHRRSDKSVIPYRWITDGLHPLEHCQRRRSLAIKSRFPWRLHRLSNGTYVRLCRSNTDIVGKTMMTWMMMVLGKCHVATQCVERSTVL
jgi:hypothetical protein